VDGSDGLAAKQAIQSDLKSCLSGFQATEESVRELYQSLYVLTGGTNIVEAESATEVCLRCDDELQDVLALLQQALWQAESLQASEGSEEGMAQ